MVTVKPVRPAAAVTLARPDGAGPGRICPTCCNICPFTAVPLAPGTFSRYSKSAMADKVYTKTWVRVTVICALGAALISAAAVIISALLGQAPPRTEITITNPRDGDQVSKAFTVRGETTSIESRDVHVWPAVEIGNLLWIKEPEIRVEDRLWKAEIVEGGNPPPDGFSLLLVGVTAKGREYITQWIAQCKKTGAWPGININEIPGAYVLGRVDNLKFK
jgi:hypothetical protein